MRGTPTALCLADAGVIYFNMEDGQVVISSLSYQNALAANLFIEEKLSTGTTAAPAPAAQVQGATPHHVTIVTPSSPEAPPDHLPSREYVELLLRLRYTVLQFVIGFTSDPSLCPYQRQLQDPG